MKPAGHEQKLEQLFFRARKPDISEAHLQKPIAAALHRLQHRRVVKVFGISADRFPQFLHRSKMAEDRLCGSAQLLRDVARVDGIHPLFAQQP
ncbi:hypothetical protein D1872_275580 [compost metagenome]